MKPSPEYLRGARATARWVLDQIKGNMLPPSAIDALRQRLGAVGGAETSEDYRAGFEAGRLRGRCQGALAALSWTISELASVEAITEHIRELRLKCDKCAQCGAVVGPEIRVNELCRDCRRKK